MNQNNQPTVHFTYLYPSRGNKLEPHKRRSKMKSQTQNQGNEKVNQDKADAKEKTGQHEKGQDAEKAKPGHQEQQHKAVLPQGTIR